MCSEDGFAQNPQASEEHGPPDSCMGRGKLQSHGLLYWLSPVPPLRPVWMRPMNKSACVCARACASCVSVVHAPVQVPTYSWKPGGHQVSCSVTVHQLSPTARRKARVAVSSFPVDAENMSWTLVCQRHTDITPSQLPPREGLWSSVLL